MTPHFRRAIRRQIGLNTTGLVLFGIVAGLLALGISRETELRAVIMPPAPVLNFGTWFPSRGWYAPGEDVYFWAEREGYVRPGEQVAVDLKTSWQLAQGYGLNYPTGPTIPGVVTVPGRHDLCAVRSLPQNMLPGRYRLVGRAETATNTAASRVFIFFSEPFTVSLETPEDARP